VLLVIWAILLSTLLLLVAVEEVEVLVGAVVLVVLELQLDYL
jgi:hypothetical protein